MKFLLLTLILAFSTNIQKACSQDFTLDISKQGSEWVFSIIPSDPTNLPTVGDIMTDMTFSVTFPTSANVTVSTTSPTSLISKSGSIILNPGLPGNSIQQFAVKPGPDGIGMMLNSSMMLSVPYEIGRVVFSSAGMPGDEALISPFGQVASNQPNIGINLNDQITNVSGFAPLPLKLHTFSAEKDGDRSARLDWTTSSEINSAYFGIERSKDGNTWKRIGQVAAAGNSQSEQTYTYVDRNLPMVRDRDNVYYYRLQMTDLDGAFSHSDIRGVNLGKFAGAEVSIYPNPTVDMIHVDVSGISLEEGEVSLSVYDMNGRNMVSKNIIGSGIEVIDAAQYPAGTYDVVVKQGPNIYQKKVIKID